MKDLIIVGAGPAGLTAAIYGVRAGMTLTVLEKLSPGGQVMNTYEVENYPGFVEPVAGWELMSRMEEQARRLGVDIQSGEAAAITRDSSCSYFIMTLTDGARLEARSVIITAGASFKKLNVPGEKEFIGRGVSYCATCDGAFFKDKAVAVIGGGDTALEEAHFLTRFASRVFLVHRRSEFRGTKILQDRVFASDKIEIIWDSVVTRINGTVKVESATLRNVVKGEERDLSLDGVFVFVGYDANTGFVDKTLLNQWGEIIVDSDMKTAIPGLYAAGDNRSSSKRQIVMACADGATAAMEAYQHITHLK